MTLRAAAVCAGHRSGFPFALFFALVGIRHPARRARGRSSFTFRTAPRGG